jgi:hypothetical protein
VKHLLAAAVALVPAVAAAQQGFVETAQPDQPEPERNQTRIRMRMDVTGGAFVESQMGAAPVENTSITSPNSIYWMDVRGKLDARHISGSKVDAMGDLRIRLNPDPSSPSRGYQGGEEYDLKEAYGVYRGEKVDFGFGRQILRDVDAQMIDGLTLLYRTSPKFEMGFFAGLYPDPFSRSIEDDYKVVSYRVDPATMLQFASGETTVDPIPVAAGTWGGYRYPRAYGAVGLAAVLPRNDDPPPLDPAAPPDSENRLLLTSNGYWRTLQSVDLIHYVVLEARNSRESPNVVNAQLAAHWRASSRLLLEAGASRMSSYAVEVYLRDLLERQIPFVGVCPDIASTLCIQNNIDVIRVASNEVRAGGNYLFPIQRIDVNTQVRYREREGLVLPEGLPVFNADRQIDAAFGLRKKNVAGWDLGGSFAVIRGKRTAANVFGARASRQIGETLYVDLDGGYSQYEDMCDRSMLDMRTCDGTARGFTYRLGGLGTWQRDLHWLFIADYHLNLNKAQAIRFMLVEKYPLMAGHAFFLRAQYRY